MKLLWQLPALLQLFNNGLLNGEFAICVVFPFTKTKFSSSIKSKLHSYFQDSL